MHVCTSVNVCIYVCIFFACMYIHACNKCLCIHLTCSVPALPLESASSHFCLQGTYGGRFGSWQQGLRPRNSSAKDIIVTPKGSKYADDTYSGVQSTDIGPTLVVSEPWGLEPRSESLTKGLYGILITGLRGFMRNVDHSSPVSYSDGLKRAYGRIPDGMMESRL